MSDEVPAKERPGSWYHEFRDGFGVFHRCSDEGWESFREDCDCHEETVLVRRAESGEAE